MWQVWELVHKLRALSINYLLKETLYNAIYNSWELRYTGFLVYHFIKFHLSLFLVVFFKFRKLEGKRQNSGEQHWTVNSVLHIWEKVATQKPHPSIFSFTGKQSWGLPLYTGISWKCWQQQSRLLFWLATGTCHRSRLKIQTSKVNGNGHCIHTKLETEGLSYSQPPTQIYKCNILPSHAEVNHLGSILTESFKTMHLYVEMQQIKAIYLRLLTR